MVDGSGRPGFRADLAVEEGRIVAIGSLQPLPFDLVFQIDDLIVAPGFIDIHNHSASGILEKPQAVSQVSQGITTLMVGPDGSSPFPLAPYAQQVETGGTAVNLGLFVGHGTLREVVMGSDFRRTATPRERAAMAALVAVAMDQGAFGLSTGLEYDPGYYSTTEELVQLARMIARTGGLYMTHIRDEEEGFLEALGEAIEIGRLAGVRVQVSHLKLGNRRVWGRTGEVLSKLHAARAQGVDIRADSYPYNAWASGLAILVPSRRFEDVQEIEEGLEKVGGPDKILITRYPPNPSFEFKNLAQIARERSISPVDLFRELIQGGGADVVCESMSNLDVQAFYRDPLVMVASDGGIDSRHPRKAGTFPRVLGRFVREQNLMTFEEAVQKMTSMPAEQLGLDDRGVLATGSWADLVVFDPRSVIDRSTFHEPDLPSKGIVMTMVNGTIVWRNQRATGKLPGKVLKRK